MRTAIIIVSYNGRQWLKVTLDSCAQFASSAVVYLVDNASTDGSADFVAEHFPGVKLQRELKNLGFAGGNNLGIQHALADGAEAVLLLNQDAELHAGTLPELVEALEHNQKVGAVQPAIYLPSGKVNSFGNRFHYLGFGWAGGYQATLAEAEAQLPWVTSGTEPPYLSGAALFLRATALQQVGLLDEALFMYHEDLELCFRLRLAGWHLALCSAARVTHHYEFHRSTQSYYFMERNRFVVWLSYFRAQTLAVIVPLWLITELPLLIVAFLQGWGAEKLRAYAYLGRPTTWVDIKQRRARLRSLRTLSDRTLLSYASSTIEFQEVDSFLTQNVFNPVSQALWLILFPLIRS